MLIDDNIPECGANLQPAFLTFTDVPIFRCHPKWMAVCWSHLRATSPPLPPSSRLVLLDAQPCRPRRVLAGRSHRISLRDPRAVDSCALRACRVQRSGPAPGVSTKGRAGRHRRVERPCAVTLPFRARAKNRPSNVNLSKKKSLAEALQICSSVARSESLSGSMLATAAHVLRPT